MTDALTHYTHALTHMRTASSRAHYPAATKHRAPHKSILLLAVLDLIEQREITTNFVPLSPALADLFSLYWDLTMPEGKINRLFLPFFHMKNDGFWHLIPQHGQDIALDTVQQIGGSRQLRDLVLGAQFDHELFELLIVKATRDQLRSAIIDAYFTPDIGVVLLAQASINHEAHQYSLELLAQARTSAAGRRDESPDKRPVRDQGFRKAVVTAYDHRCVLCGVRLVTYEGRTAATAAHIIPWSVSYNDDPRNGLCLCRLCHWAFDTGLAGISARYLIRLSEQMGAEGNIPGHLSTLNDRPIFEPTEPVFNPDVDALKWHLHEVFLG